MTKAITFLRAAEVMKRTSLSRTTMFEMIEAGQFPRQVKLGARCAAWIEGEVESWMQERIAASRSQQ